MMKSIPHTPTIPSTRACPSRPRLRALALPALTACVLCCGACSENDPAYRPTVTDTRPVGQGLKVIGFAMVGAAVVVVLGRMIR